MKERWEYKKLGEIATEMYRGSGIKRDQVTNEGTPCVRYGEIYTTYNISFDSCVSHTKAENIPSPKFFEHGDLLFAITGESVEDIGKTIAYLGNEKCLCGGDIICMKHHQNPKYLAYALSTPDAIRQKGIGKTKLKVVHTNAPSLRSISIPIAPLDEQQSIVDYLDSAFAKIDAMKANAEKSLNEAKALFQASLKEMLEPKEGWEEKKLKEICETITDFVAAGSFASLRENVVYNNEKDYAQLVRTTDLKSGFSKGGYVYVNEHAFKYLYRVNLDKECIILPNVGVNCGEVYYVTPSILPYDNNVLGPNAVLVRSNNYNNHFLSYLFLGKDFQNKLSDITSHMAQPKFNKTGLKEIVILVPPISEQQSIVETLDSLKSKVDRLQANYDKISQECDALKQAILRQVFE